MPRRITLIALMAIIILSWLPAQAGNGPVIGAEANDHQRIVAELAAALLARQGLAPSIRSGLSADEMKTMLAQGEIDLCVTTVPADAEVNLPGVKMLAPLNFTTGPALIVREKLADKHGIKSISQLAASAGIFRFAGLDAETARLLASRYSLKPAVRQQIPEALRYQALKNEKIDIALGRADDGRIVAYRLRVLADDRRALPVLRPTPLVATAALEKYPAITKAIDTLRQRLDSEAMRRLHGAAVIAHRQPGEVASEWLHDQGLL